MSYLYRWVRHNQSLASRSTALLKGGNILETSSLGNIKPLYQVNQTKSIMTTPPALMTQPGNRPNSPSGRPGGQEPPKDDIKYVIKFKDFDVKKTFKQFYSLYGPLFVVCHIGIGLMSLGFFCSLTYFAIDLNQFIPLALYHFIGERMADMTGTGGKFVLAYAIHKAILPFRLCGAIYLARYLSRYVKKRRTQ